MSIRAICFSFLSAIVASVACASLPISFEGRVKQAELVCFGRAKRIEIRLRGDEVLYKVTWLEEPRVYKGERPKGPLVMALRRVGRIAHQIEVTVDSPEGRNLLLLLKKNARGEYCPVSDVYSPEESVGEFVHLPAKMPASPEGLIESYLTSSDGEDQSRTLRFLDSTSNPRWIEIVQRLKEASNKSVEANAVSILIKSKALLASAKYPFTEDEIDSAFSETMEKWRNAWNAGDGRSLKSIYASEADDRGWKKFRTLGPLPAGEERFTDNSPSGAKRSYLYTLADGTKWEVECTLVREDRLPRIRSLSFQQER